MLVRRLAMLLLAIATGPSAYGRDLAGQSPVFSVSEYAMRRAALAARVTEGVVLVLGAPEPRQDFLAFFQDPSFDYLTGVHEPDAALLLVKGGGRMQSTIFVQPRDPGREVWTGARMGAVGATALTGIAGRDIGELRPTLDSLLDTGLALYVIGDLGGGEGLDARPLTVDAQFVESFRARHRQMSVHDLRAVVLDLRARKSGGELAQITRAAEITVEAQRQVLKVIAPGRNEYEAQAVIEYTFRRNGADRPSFASIVGSGPNSTTLHYNTDNRIMQAGEVVVVDIGASEHGYAADVTRTVPVSGAFSADQRRIYQLVRDAQAAAERQATSGARARLMNDSATAVIARGLAELGLIEGPDAAYDCAGGGERGCPQYRLYFMHGLGHGIGLEVHDPDQYYSTGKIDVGSAFTIEPGIYVRANLLETLLPTPRNRSMIERIRPSVERYRNIGVRIEDDYIVTDRGVEWISRSPREADEVERMMKGPGTAP
ncbi:MAG: aminopeptidase P N-terminal domain-containing protein [Gemmatimonadaceae bacterium]